MDSHGCLECHGVSNIHESVLGLNQTYFWHKTQHTARDLSCTVWPQQTRWLLLKHGTYTIKSSSLYNSNFHPSPCLRGRFWATNTTTDLHFLGSIPCSLATFSNACSMGKFWDSNQVCRCFALLPPFLYSFIMHSCTYLENAIRSSTALDFQYINKVNSS